MFCWGYWHERSLTRETTCKPSTSVELTRGCNSLWSIQSAYSGNCKDSDLLQYTSVFMSSTFLLLFSSDQLVILLSSKFKEYDYFPTWKLHRFHLKFLLYYSLWAPHERAHHWDSEFIHLYKCYLDGFIDHLPTK